MSEPRSARVPLLPLLLILALCADAGPALAQVESLTEQIRESRERLQQIREERRRLRAEMEDLMARLHNVNAELQNLNKQIAAQEAIVRELDHQLAIRDQRVLATTGELLRTRDELSEKRALFARRARDLYKRGPLGSVQVLLAAQNFSDLINRYQYLYLVALQDRLLVQQIEELTRELSQQRDRLRRDVDALRRLRGDKVGELQDLYGLEQQRTRRLSSYRGQRASTERRIAELSRDEEELTNLVERLERERSAAEALAANAPTAGTLTPEDAGRLDWPVDGRLIYGYGQQRNEDGTVILRQGVGIAAPVDAPVEVIQGGTVVFAEPYFGYGPSVIVSHGGGYYSLYLYLSELLVTAGDRVEQGQPIGRVGGAGTPEGPHIELQIRQGRKAVDPAEWLRQRRD